MKPWMWMVVWVAVAFINGYELGTGQALSVWWWAGMVVMFVSPWALHVEYTHKF